jgi:hypothetical protein
MATNPFEAALPPVDQLMPGVTGGALPVEAVAEVDQEAVEADLDSTPSFSAKSPAADIDKAVLRNYLCELLHEAKAARETGPEARDLQWRRNWEAYWTRYDHSGKEEWQAKESLPDVANFVERFVASLRKALTASGEEWFAFDDPLDQDGRLEATVKNIVEYGLSGCGKNSTGQPVSFPVVFADGMKAGAVMMPAFAVLWRGGRLVIDVVDARELYYDPTGRGLYRFREYEIDKWQLADLRDLRDGDGNYIYDRDAIDRCAAAGGKAETQTEDKERSGGHGQESTHRFRKTFAIQEFLGHILDEDGNCVAKNQVVVMANETEIILGPENNPWWHARDWIVSAPLVSVPFSVYGKSYVESFAALAQTFVDMTNMLLDAIQVTSIPAFQGWPDAMEDPTQLDQGVSPGKVFLANDDAQQGQPFITRIDFGNVNPDAFRAWESIRGLLREGSSQNELRLGQLTKRSGVTATEIDAAEGGTEALLEHLAEDVEQQLLTPILNLVWPTMLQHLDPEKDERLRLELGKDVSDMIATRRNEFRDRTVQLTAKGISGLLKRSRLRRALLEVMQIVGQSEVMGQVFARSMSFQKLLSQILRTGGIDPRTLEMSDQEKAAQIEGAEAARRNAGMGGGGGGLDGA